MVLKHFEAVIFNLIFAGFEWIVCRYLLLHASNIFITTFPAYSGTPHVQFMLAFIHWGMWILVLLPTSIYLWTQTQRPEIEP